MVTSKYILADKIGNLINVNDYVYHYNYVYKVLELNKPTALKRGYVKMLKVNPICKTTKPVYRHSSEMCVLDKLTVENWINDSSKRISND